jgi:hypothetical protein
MNANNSEKHMTRMKFLGAYVVLAGLLCLSSIYAESVGAGRMQTQSNPPGKVSVSSPGVFKRGDSFVFLVTIANTSHWPITFIREVDEEDFDIVIVDSKDHVIPRQDSQDRNTMPRSGRSYAVKLARGESYAFVLDLSHKYALSKGDYRITFGRQLLDSVGNVVGTIHSHAKSFSVL